MSLTRLVLRSLVYYRRTGLVVAVGIAVAASVIVGSLVIGDSIRGSLRKVALARLGYIFDAVTSPRFFCADLADKADLWGIVEPLVMLDGSAREQSSDAVIANVTVIGVDGDFWRLFPDTSVTSLSRRSCVINESLAADAGVSAGDTLVITISRAGKVAADALFARRQREDTLTTLQVTVEAVLPDLGPGGFRLDAAVMMPRNVFVNREWLAGRIGLPGSANALVLAPLPGPQGYPSVDQMRRTDALGPTPPNWQLTELAKAMTLEDYGLYLRVHGGRLSVTSDAVTLNNAQVKAATSAARQMHVTPETISVYLADTIVAAQDPARTIAYAVVAGLPRVTDLAVIAGESRLGPGDLILNSWAAQDLDARVGERFTLTWRVGTPSGYEDRSVELTLRGITAMEGPAADPGLVPEFEGITEATTIDDWDPPFPIDLSRITERDEAYWDRYRAAPKAFVHPDLLKRMWQGIDNAGPWVTSVTVCLPAEESPDAFKQRFEHALLAALEPEDIGMRVVTVREQALEASRGTSDFASLFLGMSMFLVFAGAALAGMLMRLSAQRRASQAGIMLATGFQQRTVGRTIAAESVLLSLIGTIIGIPLGIGYAHSVIGALTSHWQGALGDTPALWVFVYPLTVGEGAVSALAVGVLATWWGARVVTARPVLELLRGWQASSVQVSAGRSWTRGVLLALLAMAAVLLIVALATEAVPSQGAFFGVGALLLGAALAGTHILLQRVLRWRDAPRSIGRLALRSAAANRGRSLLLIGLLGVATFVIVAVAANSRDFSRVDIHDRTAGTGGFSLLATSSIPLRFDPATEEGRANLGFLPDEQEVLRGVEIISLMRSPGEDISCRNIARPTHPRLLGVSEAMIARDGFRVITSEEAPDDNPWSLLKAGPTGDIVPAFGDAASVQWQIHSGLGKSYSIETPRGEVNLRFVGVLAGSIFQSELLVPEDELRRLYPQVDGPSCFLVDAPEGREDEVAEALRSALGAMGLQVRSTREVLNDYIQVQNTYLMMFLALGGLGLVLGTIGLVAVILRSAFERRAEFALMLATGFTRANLAWLLVVENEGLLIVGMVIGTATALIAVAPHLASAQASVNWAALVSVLAAIVLVGVVACVAGAWSSVRGRLIDALRTE